MRVPIFQQGARASQVRQNSQNAAASRFALEQAIKQTTEDAISAWESWTTAKERIKRFEDQVKAAILSRDRAILEAEVGERAYFEVLDLQRDVLRAQLNLAQAFRDEVVAQYQICSVMGRLTAKHLKLPVELYDVKEQYEKTRFKFFGFGDTPDWDPLTVTDVYTQEQEAKASAGQSTKESTNG